MLVAGEERVFFEAAGASLSIEESVLFATPIGAQRTLQIVASGEAAADTVVDWSFTRAGSA